MIPIDQTSILGSILPDIYINKITLETSGEASTDSNPHIDHEREPDIIIDQFGKRIRRPIPADLTKKSNEDNAEPLKVTIELLIKEKLEDDFIASWFSQQDFVKYLKVKIIQCLNADISKDFISGARSLGLDSISGLEHSSNLIESKILSVQDYVTDSSLDEFALNVDDNGNKVYDITFRISFNIKNPNPEHLSYFAVSFLDLKALAKDYGLTLPPDMKTDLDGKPYPELVIDNYSVVSEAFYFQTPQGDIWNGAVISESNGRWKTNEGENSRYLEIVKTNNDTVQDFRHVKEIEKQIIDLSFVENDIFSANSKIKLITNKNLDIIRKNSYFSTCYLSQDLNGNARFAFSIDYKKLVKENAVFGKFYTDQNEELLLQNMRIRSLKLLRARIKDSILQDERNIVTFDEEEDPTDILIASGENGPFSFNSNENRRASIRELKLFLEDPIVGVRHFTGIDKESSTLTTGKYQYGIEIEIEDQSSNYLLDKINKLILVNSMLYSYYSEASIPVSRFNIVGSSNNIGNFDISSGHLTQNFINEQENKYKGKENESPWVLSISLYLSTMDLLTENFDREKYERNLISFVHPNTATPDTILIIYKLLDNLIITLSKLVGISVGPQIGSIAAQKEYIAKNTRSKNGVPYKSFKVEYFFTSIFDSDKPKSYGFDFLSFNSGIDNIINTDGLFVLSQQNYRDRTQKETLKYFRTINENINLKTNKVSYTTDDSIENSRYTFLSPSTIRVGDKQIFNLLDSKISVNDTDNLMLLASNILRFNNDISSIYVPTKNSYSANSNLLKSNQNIKDNLLSIFNRKNLTILSNDEIKQQFVLDNKTAYVDSTDVISKTSPFHREDMSKDTFDNDMKTVQKLNANPNNFLMKLGENLIENGVNSNLIPDKLKEEQKDIKNSINYFDINHPKNGLESKLKIISTNISQLSLTTEALQERARAVQDNAVSYIKSLPNQIKSLFVGSINSTAVTNTFSGKLIADKLGGAEKDPFKQSEVKLVFKMNYKILNQIYYLSGFLRGTNQNDNCLFKSPIWRPLTSAIVNRSLSSNLLCKMSEYRNVDLDIVKPSGLSLDTYNEYFILSPERKIIDPPLQQTLSKVELSVRNISQLSQQKFNIRPENIRTIVINSKIGS
jgi:hypothetical protein